MKKIIHIQTGVPSSGDSTFRFHNYLIANGYDSKILVLTSNRKSTDIKTFSGAINNVKVFLNNKFEQFITKKQKANTGKYSWPLFGTKIINNSWVKDADFIFVYWAIGGFQSFSGLKAIFKLNKPTIVFMRDMWTITGGCHHSFGCTKYQTECTRCPLFNNPSSKGIAYFQLKRKQKLFASFSNISFAAPSKWLTECAKSSIVTKNKKVYHLPNLINTNIYKPINLLFARELTCLPLNVKLIGFGAKGGTDNAYKGWPYLVDALHILKSDNKDIDFQVVIFGRDFSEDITKEIPFETNFAGFLYDDYALSLLYNALDLFIVPSVADNLPSTVLESLSCGVPVVGFKTGGIPDMIEHKKNGYLAEYKNSGDLAKGIYYCLRNNLVGRLPEDLDPNKTLKKYLEIIES